jgi:hypothetical protein
MLKIFIFIKKRRDVGSNVFTARYFEHAKRLLEEWPTLLRLAVGRSVPMQDCPTPPIHDGVAVGWLTDVEHALHFGEQWAADSRLYADVDATLSVVTREVIVRGESYLMHQRGSDVGLQELKMMSFAKRSEDLTLAELTERWAVEAGRMGATAIPSDLLGNAYVQNHVVPLDGREWPYDAINEVWFEDRHALERRFEYFRTRREAAAQSVTRGLFHPDIQFDLVIADHTLIRSF